MANNLTIVMYHYVRPLKESRYPEIKALELDNFRGQLDFIQHHYTAVTMEDVIAASRGEARLPEQAILLTFDDGYRDHYEHVLPVLVERGVQGSFFPPACAVRDGRVLDVNKIHFTLASGTNPQRLVDEIFVEMDVNRKQYGLLGNAEYFETFSRESRYDSAEVTFIKRILQKGLPAPMRGPLIDRLFRQFVTQDERDFATELYMTDSQLRDLLDAGMFIGSHGDQHLWLNTLSGEEQLREVETSLEFLADIGAAQQEWVMCYPFGGYNEALLSLLRRRGCALGLTVDVGVADLAITDPLCLPRLDTNDLPSSLDVYSAHSAPASDGHQLEA
ncbi:MULTISPECIES: polysaccharide deacetylase family protein [Halomonadaceae]|uniref:polysaccharide deacetylase family protein n=1 Tax=Halomonadaceae TaxID=28256 RepID=UPI00158445B9|nr:MULTISPECIES: polysaccharide deacetylase family protein [Halomonas]MDI4635986.1 polysaccharide deacetylase family protein [Halomonas sp. BMC7]NUJ60351.1 polysaccharide deacetylase family protein [Halomonas taeanensis]